MIHDDAGGLGRAVLRAGEQAEPVRAVVDEAVHIGGERLELGAQAVECERGIRDPPPVIRILRVRQPGAQRGAAADRVDGELERAVRDHLRRPSR